MSLEFLAKPRRRRHLEAHRPVHLDRGADANCHSGFLSPSES